MKIHYNLIGTERKKLVAALSRELNAETKYLGAPTFEYEVGPYRIDKVGTVTGTDNHYLVTYLGDFYSIFPISEEYDTSPDVAEANAYAEREIRRMELEAQNVPDYSNRGQYGGDEIPEYWENGMTEEEEMGLGRRRRESFQGENGMSADDVPDTDESDSLTVEMPREEFTQESLENLTKMVAAKQTLIKSALMAEELPIQVTGNTVAFPWFILNKPEDAMCYAQFVHALCKTAKKKQRVTAKEKGELDNPKYAMRCFLLSIGLIGNEYKAARKLLLSNLSGSSAFKNGTPHKAHAEPKEKAENATPVTDSLAETIAEAESIHEVNTLLEGSDE